MRIRTLSTVIAACCAASLFAADPPVTKQNSIEIGGWPSADVKKAKSAVSEYEPTGGGLLLNADVSFQTDANALQMKVIQQGSDSQQHQIAFDIKRIIRSVTQFDRLPHELGHDPMRNLAAATAAGRQLWATDTSPGAPYGYRFSTLDHRTEFQAGSHVTFAATFNDQQRDGHKQVFALSHCEGCHVQSTSRPIDERTRTAGLETNFTWLGGALRAGFDKRELREGVPYVLNQFDRALHPELRTPLFDNRLQFGTGEGPLPIDLRPDIDKSIGRVDLVLPSVAGFAMTGGGVWSQTENRYTGLKASYSGYALTAARVLPHNWRFQWRGRAYALRNDDVFIDVVEPVAIAGPPKGKTYREIYGFDPDWTRLSALDRNVLDSHLELSRRLGKRAGTLRMKWSYNGNDRQNYEVAPGQTKTTTNVVALAWNTRLAIRFRFDARYSHGFVDNPLMLVNGACSTFTSGSVASPLDPSGAQYYRSQSSRVADTTASPESWDEVRLGSSYAFGRSLIASNARLWNGRNRSGDLTDWSRQNWNATMMYSFTPSEKWNWFAGYTTLHSTIDSPICVALYDG